MNDLWAHIWEVIGSIVGTVFIAFLGYLAKQIKDANVRAAIWEAIEVGVATAQSKFVDWAKRASADGHLSKEERHEALQIAKTTAMDFAATPKVREAVSAMAAERLEAMVQRILARKENVVDTTNIGVVNTTTEGTVQCAPPSGSPRSS